MSLLVQSLPDEASLGAPELVILIRHELKSTLHRVVVLLGKHDVHPDEISHLVDSLSYLMQPRG